MRTVFLGTSQFAAQVLEILAGSAHRPTLVITRPDRPRGRGRRLSSPPVADAARVLELSIDQPDDVNGPAAGERVAAERPDAVVVCAFGALIREPLLSAHPMVNVHPSLLPRWRGAAPVERAIMAGDRETGVSIMALTAGLDSGPVFRCRAEPIAADDSYGTLAARLAELGATLLIEVLDSWPAAAQPQPGSGVTYAEKITAADRRLDPMRPAAELERVVRGLAPHIGAYIESDALGRLGVLEARAEPDGAAPGELTVAGSWPVLGTASGGLRLLTVQPPGRRAMSGEDYLRGRRRP